MNPRPLLFYARTRFTWSEVRISASSAASIPHWENLCKDLSAERRVEVLYNKALRLRFDNHEQATMKIPAKHADPLFFSAASEVVTMEFGIRTRRARNLGSQRIGLQSLEKQPHRLGINHMERRDGVALEKR